VKLGQVAGVRERAGDESGAREDARAKYEARNPARAKYEARDPARYGDARNVVSLIRRCSVVFYRVPAGTLLQQPNDKPMAARRG
jgi:hypothetical protein